MTCFLDQIYATFCTPTNTRDDMLRFAARCGSEVRVCCPIIREEMEGMAEGSGLRHEEVALLTHHEERHHCGLPKLDPSTAVAAGPPDTNGGDPHVGQRWNWTASMLPWKRRLANRTPAEPVRREASVEQNTHERRGRMYTHSRSGLPDGACQQAEEAEPQDVAEAKWLTYLLPSSAAKSCPASGVQARLRRRGFAH